MTPEMYGACPELEIALQAVDAGRTVLMEHWQQELEIREKSRNDLVTAADLASEEAIVATIRQALPTHNFLAEESHADAVDSEHLWVIDPLDGTTNFAHGIPHFAISVAYYRAGEPVCGVILNPVRNDLYLAVKEVGAFHNRAPVRVGFERHLSEVLVGVGFYYDRGAMMEATLDAVADLFRRQIRGIRRFGTASLDLAHVGSGRYGAFFEYQLSPWDFAAGRLFVEEAGGRVTTAEGDALPLAQTSVLASNGLLHDAVLAVISNRHR